MGVMNVVRKVVDLGPRLPADLSVRNPITYFTVCRLCLGENDVNTICFHWMFMNHPPSTLGPVLWIFGLIHQPPPTLRDVCTLGMGEVCTIVPTNC